MKKHVYVLSGHVGGMAVSGSDLWVADSNDEHPVVRRYGEEGNGTSNNPITVAALRLGQRPARARLRRQPRELGGTQRLKEQGLGQARRLEVAKMDRLVGTVHPRVRIAHSGDQDGGFGKGGRELGHHGY